MYVPESPLESHRYTESQSSQRGEYTASTFCSVCEEAARRLPVLVVTVC